MLHNGYTCKQVARGSAGVPACLVLRHCKGLLLRHDNSLQCWQLSLAPPRLLQSKSFPS